MPITLVEVSRACPGWFISHERFSDSGRDRWSAVRTKYGYSLAEATPRYLWSRPDPRRLGNGSGCPTYAASSFIHQSSTTKTDQVVPMTPPVRRADSDVLTPDEVQRLMKACSRRAPTGIRNAALIGTTWRCGLRIGETLALRPKDVDLDYGTLTVQHGKGDKRRVVGLDAGTIALISRWLEVRRRLPAGTYTPVYCNLRGRKIDQSYVRHLLPRLARRAGIDKRVHPHALRHAFAVELEREGAPLSTIRDLLGHSSAAVTDRYPETTRRK
jgi:integrase/recombinase XerD